MPYIYIHNYIYMCNFQPFLFGSLLDPFSLSLGAILQVRSNQTRWVPSFSAPGMKSAAVCGQKHAGLLFVSLYTLYI